MMTYFSTMTRFHDPVMKQQSEVVMNYTLLDNFKTWAYLHSTIL